MKVKIQKTEEVQHVETSFGSLTENKTGTYLVLNNKHFGISALKQKDGSYRIAIDYVIHRPCHDHSNRPTIAVIVPADGVQECECGKHEDKKATLVIETASGHLMLETFFKNYVWYKKARFGIPHCCWRGEDQK